MIAGAVMLRELFPKRELVASPPRIETHYDTVTARQLDTLWRWREKLVRDARAEHERDSLRTLLERSTTSVPETVFVVTDLDGITALAVGANVGDSTLVAGFSLARLDTGYAFRRWQDQFYTTGPLKSLVLDGSMPRVTFYSPQKKPCQSGCKLKHYLTGMVAGAAIWEVFR